MQTPSPAKVINTPKNPGKHLIVVITALEEELDYLLQMPFGWSGPLLQDDGISYKHGTFSNNIDIIASSARRMGLVATAIVTAKVLKEWNPTITAMIGVCGGRKEKGLNIGDIVVANHCFHYQFGAFEKGKFIRELRVENVQQLVTDIAEDLIKRTQKLLDIERAPPAGFKTPITKLQGHVGPMASADLVVKDVVKLVDAVEADRKTIAIDMESYAFMQAANLARIPHAFVIKSFSDFADADKDDGYREYAKFTCTQFFIEVTKKLAEQLGNKTKNSSAIVSSQSSTANEQIVYSSGIEDLGYDFEDYGSLVYQNKNGQRTPIGDIPARGALNSENGGILTIQRFNTEGRFEVWLKHYVFNGETYTSIPKDESILSSRQIRVSCEARAVDDGIHTLRLVLKNEKEDKWIKFVEQTIIEKHWTRMSMYVDCSPNEEYRLRIDDYNVSKAPSSVQIRNFVVTEKKRSS